MRIGFGVLAAALTATVIYVTAAFAADVVGDPLIDGAAVQGSTLRVAVTWDEPPSDPDYEWLRLPASDDDDDDRRTRIDGADQAEYTPTAADVGRRIAVRVRDDGKWRYSALTAVVVAAPTRSPVPAQPAPTPSPTPAPTPSPAPTLPSGGAPPPVLQAALLRPFPLVRIKGSVAGGGARVTLLRVRASRRTQVRVRCSGRGCPLRRLSRKPGRIRPLERFLRAGVRITIRVTRPGFVGKHVRLVIRSRKPPTRTDACAMRGRPGAVPCPA